MTLTFEEGQIVLQIYGPEECSTFLCHAVQLYRQVWNRAEYRFAAVLEIRIES